MRPLPGEDVHPGRPAPRVSDNDIPTAFQHPSGPQMTYFVAEESAMDAVIEQPSSHSRRARDPRKHNVAEPADSGAVLSGPSSRDRDRSTTPSGKGHIDTDLSSIGSVSPRYQHAGPSTVASHAATSQPMTPVMLGASGPASAFSGSSSRRNSLSGSLSEDLGSQALSMNEELEPEPSASMMDSGSAPQLIMPSIKMPSRRPFTEEGKRLGRLKVLIAGDSSIGKTSLVKAIVQSCEHIVHVDPIAPQQMSLVPRSSPRKSRSKSSRPDNVTAQITEIYASTKPYPEWWSDLDDFRVLARRKSLGDTVLDRNICFVDTPGYGHGASCMEAITPVIQYVESHFERVHSNASSDAEMLNMLGGDGGSQVDVVFYIIRNRLKPVDMQYLKQLAPLTNVIPLLAQADTLSSEDLFQIKARINSELIEAGIRPFQFATMSADSSPVVGASPLYAISSAPGSDHDTMDASLLMSPDYVQPLIPSELEALVQQVFCENGTSWLRHSAARKYLQWRKSDNASRPQALYRPLSMPNAISTSLVTSAPLTPPIGATSSYSLARIADHTLREERLAQVRLANWASDLQRSLANERTRYEQLARSERAIWLTEKLNECVQDGTLVAVGKRSPSTSPMREKIRRKLAGDRMHSSKTMRHQDPLGLLEVAAELKSKSWVALELLGSLGVLGGLAFWMAKHYWHFQAYEYVVSEWYKFWYGDR